MRKYDKWVKCDTTIDITNQDKDLCDKCADYYSDNCGEKYGGVLRYDDDGKMTKLCSDCWDEEERKEHEEEIEEEEKMVEIKTYLLNKKNDNHN